LICAARDIGPGHAFEGLEFVQMKLRNTMLALVAIAGMASAASINQPRENQKNRIAQGVRSGELTARETAHLERGETRLNRQIRNDRARNNRHLTAAERTRINHEQNRLSRTIHRDKHDARF
jgi:hypothetical protein